MDGEFWEMPKPLNVTFEILCRILNALYFHFYKIFFFKILLFDTKRQKCCKTLIRQKNFSRNMIGILDVFYFGSALKVGIRFCPGAMTASVKYLFARLEPSDHTYSQL